MKINHTYHIVVNIAGLSSIIYKFIKRFISELQNQLA